MKRATYVFIALMTLAMIIGVYDPNVTGLAQESRTRIVVYTFDNVKAQMLLNDEIYLRHDFGNGIYSADVPDTLLPKMKTYGIVETVPVYTLSASGYTSPLPYTNTKDKGIIAILDTGVVPRSRVAVCKDFTYPGIQSQCIDRNGHGTIMAEIVQPATIIAYKVCNDYGLCYADDVAAALQKVDATGAETVLICLGGEPSNILHQIIKKTRATIIAAAGNGQKVQYPAAYPEVISVGAAQGGMAVSWSAKGTNPGRNAEKEEGEIDVVADGVYEKYKGTSVAAAKIAAKRLPRNTLYKLAKDIGIEGDDAETGKGFVE